MARRVVETLSGVGKIYAGKVLLRVTPYKLNLFHDDDRPATGGALNFDGHIDIGGIGEAVVLTGTQDLRLLLEDGRLFRFELTDTGGHIMGNTGPSPTPD